MKEVINDEEQLFIQEKTPNPLQYKYELKFEKDIFDLTMQINLDNKLYLTLKDANQTSLYDYHNSFTYDEMLKVFNLKSNDYKELETIMIFLDKEIKSNKLKLSKENNIMSLAYYQNEKSFFTIKLKKDKLSIDNIFAILNENVDIIINGKNYKVNFENNNMEQTSLIIKYSSEYQIEMIFEKMIFDKIIMCSDNIDEIVKQLNSLIIKKNFKIIDKKNIIIKEKDDIALKKVKRISEDKIIEKIKEFFTCVFCKKIVSCPLCCPCPNFICKNCYINNKIDICKNCNEKYEEVKNSDVHFILKEIFYNQEIKKNKINLYIFLSKNIQELYRNNQLKMILKNKTYNEFETIIEMVDENIIDQLKYFDNYYTPLNIFDLISTIGTLINKYIISEQKKKLNNFISIRKALSYPKKSAFYISGILARFLENQGIKIAIEEKTTCPKLSKNLLDWIMIGFLKFKVIKLHLDYGKEENNKILQSEDKKNELVKKWIKKVSNKLKIEQNDLYFVSIKEGSIDLELTTPLKIEESDLESLKSENVEEILDIKYKMLVDGCLISKEMFDTRWNNSGSGWASRGEKRGGADYDPPRDYHGYGLKVSKQYDNGDDTWLGMSNVQGEWWVAYHGAGGDSSNEEIRGVIKSIVSNGLRAGQNQAYESYRNCNDRSQEEYPNVGRGVYLSNKINTAEGYAGKVKDDDNNEYKIVFMCRVCPEKVRFSNSRSDYFVLDGNNECIRPYRILLKPLKSDSSCIIC